MYSTHGIPVFVLKFYESDLVKNKDSEITCYVFVKMTPSFKLGMNLFVTSLAHKTPFLPK